MARPLVLPLPACREPALAGGKAAGLAGLLAAGFPVPSGVCLTTEAYKRSLSDIGILPRDEWNRICALPGPARPAALEDCRRRISRQRLPSLAQKWYALLRALNCPSDTRWAVRSSASNEDAGEASYAGLYRTHLAVAWDDIEQAVIDLWASVWQERVIDYTLKQGADAPAPAMAVVIQPTLAAQVSGVAYSIHPVTGHSNQVAINAVPGLAVPLVDGSAQPDQYVVQMNEAGEPMRVRRRLTADKSTRLTLRPGGLLNEPLAASQRKASSLSDDQLFTVARVAKQIERAFGCPVDVEWLFDERQLWLVQARPITTVRPSDQLSNDDCEWTRANFKETLPEVPSPMGLSFLRHFMETYILAHYRRLGCRIPPGWSPVRVLHGRPYLNVTLFHQLVGQLGGEPALNAEQMGGVALQSPPTVARIGWWAFVRAGWLMLREMRRCVTQGPAWFAEMKQQAVRYRPDRLKHHSFEALAASLDDLGHWLDRHEITFGIAAGVGQCLQAFSRLLPRWLGPDWRALFNAALQGQGTVISAQQIVRLAEVVEIARQDPAVLQWFHAEPWKPSAVRSKLAGTAFLAAFARFLEDYGHRAVGESDVMSPRITEQPESILAVIRAQLRAPAPLSASELLARQAQCRQTALDEIRRRLGWRWDRWIVFHWWYRRLTRFFALREANRHHLMYYSTAARHLLLQIGERLMKEGRLDQAEDIFFVTLDERVALLAREDRDWRGLIRSRRAEQARHAAIDVPDTIREWEEAVAGLSPPDEALGDGTLQGLPISVGCVSGPARIVRSPEDWAKVRPGDILVAPVIDPGMAPLFGLAGGLIVAMGGTLSHGAIIAREYGLPTIANVPAAMKMISEGQWVTLDAGAGTVHWNVRADSPSLARATRADRI